MNEHRSTDSPTNDLESTSRDHRPLFLILAGVALAAVLLGVMYKLDSTNATETQEVSRLVDLEEITTPSEPTREEVASASSKLDQQAVVSLQDGAWIQVAGEDGQLAQEYSADRIDPLPDQWIEMVMPKAIMYPGSGRLISMTANEGTAHVPARALESGVLEGDVVIRIYEPGPDGRWVSPSDHEPSVVINADQAEFDNVEGEIRTERAVKVTTAEITFRGEGLSILLGNDGRQIERLIVDRATAPIEIRSALADKTTRPATGSGGVGTPDGAVASASASSADSVKPVKGAASKRTPPNRPVMASMPASSPASTPATRPATTPATRPEAQSEQSGWYELVLSDDVLIERIGRDGRSTVRGDRLVATFMMGEGGVDASFASTAIGAGELVTLATATDRRNGHVREHHSRGLAGMPLARPETFLASVVATQVDEETDGDSDLVFVHYSGRLLMKPAPDAARRMGGKGDAEVVVEGVDGAGIDIEDEANEAEVTCSHLVYRAAQDTVELVGNDAHPLDLQSPRLTLSGGRFWLQRSQGRGGLIGPGRMVFNQAGSSVEAALQGLPFAVETALADAGTGASRAVMVAAVRAVQGPQDDADGSEDDGKDDVPRLEILWQEGIDLDFDDLEGSGHLRQARFQGEVKVISTDFNLASETLAVDFAKNGTREDSIERIIADGGARVDRIGEAGTLVAERIDLSLDETPEGGTVPTVMLAEGGVEASDPGQTMWTERLEVRFRPTEEGEPGEEKVRRGLAGGMDEGEVGSVEVTSVTASRNVQVRLEEGARVFADALDGDALNRNLLLAGEDVMVLRENVVADRMREIRFDDSKQTVRGNGPGRFRYYDKPVVPETRERIERPEPSSRPALAATWTESLKFEDQANGGGGRLELEGKVRVRTEQSPLEVGRLDSRRLVLDLAKTSSDLAVARKTGDGDSSEEASRELQKMTATGDAILESRTWSSAARSDEPRLFRVTGNHVEYAVDTREALVDGEGTLLVNDPRPRERKNVEDQALGQGFGVDGTTRFHWEKMMSMKREVDARYLIIMEQQVEVLHAGLDAEDTLSLTADRLEVTVERPVEKPTRVEDDGAEKKDDKGAQAPKNAEDQPYDGGVDLGGPAELLRVRGLGKVFIRTPEQDVECEEFDYNVDTEIAMLRARPGRVVTVTTKNAATPIRAELVQWDLRTGRIRILSGEGGVAR